MHRGGWDANHLGIGSLSCTWVISCEAPFSRQPLSVTEGKNNPLAETAWQMVVMIELNWFSCERNSTNKQTYNHTRSAAQFVTGNVYPRKWNSHSVIYRNIRLTTAQKLAARANLQQTQLLSGLKAEEDKSHCQKGDKKLLLTAASESNTVDSSAQHIVLLYHELLKFPSRDCVHLQSAQDIDSICSLLLPRGVTEFQRSNVVTKLTMKLSTWAQDLPWIQPRMQNLCAGVSEMVNPSTRQC